MDRSTCVFLFLGLFGASLLASPGRCTLIPAMDARQLAAEADAIVIGTVVGIRPGPRYHRVNLRVEAPLKHCRPGEILTLVLPGGPDPHAPDFVPGVPHFGLGETSLVHVEQMPSGQLTVLGGVQGRKAICNGLLVGDYQPLADAARAIEGVCGRHPDADRIVRFTSRDTPTAAAPVIASITPSEAAANMDDTVTISGQNFGPGPSLGRSDCVVFPRADHAYGRAYADIVSWSAGSIKCKVPMADSGAVTVEVDGAGISNAKRFDVTFCYSGNRVPDAAFPQPRYYNKHGTPDTTDEFLQLNRSFATWAQHGYMHSYLESTASEAEPHPSHVTSILAWCESGWPYPLEPNAPAVLVLQSNHSRGVHFNGTNGFTWAGGISGYSVRNVATHMIGHWWGLADLFGSRDREKTMYAMIKPGETRKRSLAPGDIDGIARLYPGRPAIGLERDSVRLRAEAGGSEWSNERRVKVVNEGTGYCSWRAKVTQGSQWLRVRTDVRSGPLEVPGNDDHPYLRVYAQRKNMTVLGSPYYGTVALQGPRMWSGNAVLLVTLRITGDPPCLDYHPDYSHGVYPEYAKPLVDTVNFRVLYKCPDKCPPSGVVCRMERYDRERLWEPYGTVKMTAAWNGAQEAWLCDGSDLLPENVYRTKFVAETPDGYEVGGPPTKWHRYPRMIGRPRLRWTGGTGLKNDGVKPNSGPVGTRFLFKVEYWDAAGDRPEYAQVQLRQNSKIVFTKGMMAVDRTPYWQGRTFRTGVTINRRGRYEYRFRFADATGAARGAPTRWTSGLRATDAGQGTLGITSLAARPTSGGAQLTFTLTTRAATTATILNIAGRPIKTVCCVRDLPPGTHTLLWNGETDNGLPVPSGSYLVEVAATGADGKQDRAVAHVRMQRR